MRWGRSRCARACSPCAIESQFLAAERIISVFSEGVGLKNAIKNEVINVDGNPLFERSPCLRAAIVRLGLVCLDREWRGSNAEYRFRCGRNHVFSRAFKTISQVKSGGCRVCVAEDCDARLFAKALAAGVTCLESGWLGSMVMHRFRCSCGHEWSRRGCQVLCSAGCPSCARVKHSQRMRLKDGLLKLQQIAAARGGVCLTEVYCGMYRAYAFRCAEGHEWEAMGSDVMRDTWCPVCARLRKVVDYRLQDGLERLQRKAAARGGICLADTYEGSAAWYPMRCAKGHEWMAFGKRLLRGGGWCLTCANDAKRLSISDAQKTARERGGQCLSTTYINSTTKLHWLCDKGHSWHSTFTSIRVGSWCPECAHMAQITNRKSNARRRYGKASSARK